MNWNSSLHVSKNMKEMQSGMCNKIIVRLKVLFTNIVCFEKHMIFSEQMI